MLNTGDFRFSLCYNFSQNVTLVDNLGINQALFINHVLQISNYAVYFFFVVLERLLCNALLHACVSWVTSLSLIDLPHIVLGDPSYHLAIDLPQFHLSVNLTSS